MSSEDVKNQSSESQERRPAHPGKKKKKRRRRLIIWLSAVLFFFLVVIPVLLNIYADRIFGETVREIIRVETGGKYDFTYEDISFNVFNRDLKINRLLIFPDSVNFRQDTMAAPANFQYFELEIPKLYLKGAGVFRSLIHGELEIETIFIGDPTFRLIIEETAPDTLKVSDTLAKPGFDYTKLHSYIEDYLSILRIDELELDQGNIQVHHRRKDLDRMLEIQNFSILVDDFYLDSIAHQQSERLFFSDSLGFDLKDGYFQFRSNRHLVAFKDLEISSTEGSLVIKELNLSRDTSSTHSPDKGWVELDIPLLEITGLDFTKTLSQQVVLDEIKISKSNIVYHPPSTSKEQQFNRKELAFRIYEEISSYFEPVVIKKISLENASFRISDFESETLESFTLPNLSLELYHIRIDSGSYGQRSPLFFLDDLAIQIQDQQFVLTETGQKIRFNSLKLDTRTSDAVISGFEFSPAKPGDTAGRLQFSVPKIQIQSHSLKQDFLDKALSLKSIALNRPEMNLHGVGMTDTNNHRAFGIYHLYPLIEDHLKWLDVEDFSVSEGRFEITGFDPQAPGSLSASSIDLGLTAFRLDEQGSKSMKVFYSDGITGSLNGVTMEMPSTAQKIRLNSLSFDTKSQSLEIDNLSLDSLPQQHHKKGFFLLEVLNAGFEGLDFTRLYFDKKISIRQVSLHKPVVHLFQFQKKETNNRGIDLPLDQIHTFKLNDGSVFIYDSVSDVAKVQIREADISLARLRPAAPESGIALLADSLDSHLGEIRLNLPDETHDVHLGDVFLNTHDSLLLVKSISVSPRIKTVKHDQALFEISSESFRVSGFQADRLYEQNELLCRSMVLENPRVNLELVREQNQQDNFLPLNQLQIKLFFLDLLKITSIPRFRITDADVTLRFAGREDNDRLIIQGADLAVNDFYIDETTPADQGQLLFASDLGLKINHLLRPGKQSDPHISLNKLELSTKTGSFSADSIFIEQWHNMTSLADTAKTKLIVDHFDVQGIDYHDLLIREVLDIDRIKIQKPVFLLRRELVEQDKKAEQNKKINLYRLISGRLNKINIGDLDVSDSHIKLVTAKPEKTQKFVFSRIDFDLKNILIDSTNRVFSNKFLYSDDLNFTVHDYNETTSDSLYNFGAGLVRFSSENMNLTIDSGYLTPRFGDEAFARRVGVQTDRMDLVFDRMTLNNFRLMDLFFDHALRISKVEIDKLSGDDFRDKSYPRPKNHYPPLPASALKRLDFEVSVDTLFIRNSNFTYREYVEPALEPGRIWFTDINLEGRNIVNSDSLIALNPRMMFTGSGKLMGEGNISTTVRFKLDSPEDAFSATGVVNSMDITELNPLLEHVAFVKVRKGYNNMLRFNFNADDSLSRGGMNFKYEKLKIRLIDKKNLRDDGFGESIASFIANTFVVRKNNPKLLIFNRKGDIFFIRDKEKSFFNFLAKSVLSGVQSTIRGGNEERKEMRLIRKKQRQKLREKKAREKQEQN